MDTTQLRQDFPEFASLTTYPETQIKFWLTVAGLSLDPARWSTLYNLGTELFVAHHLVLSARDNAAVAAGGTPGAVAGIVTSKAVDKVSMSMDAASVSLTDQGFWGTTLYGIRFLQLARMFGAGGVQIGAGGTPPGSVIPWP